jgi:hypothetical protein
MDSPVNWTHDFQSSQHSLSVLGRMYSHLVMNVTSAPSLCLSKLWQAKHCSGLGTQGFILYLLLLGTFLINYKKLFNYNSNLYMYYLHYLSYVSITNCTVVLHIIVLWQMPCILM